MNEEIKLCGNTSQTRFNQSRKEKKQCQKDKSGSASESDLSLRKIKKHFLLREAGFKLNVINGLYK